MTPWRHLEHRADIGVEGRGTSLAEAFAEAAVALTAVVTEPSGVRPLTPVAVSLAAPEPDLLLLDWLDALVFEMSRHRLLFGRFDVTIDEGPAGLALRATLWGEPVEALRHAPAVEVKGVTLNELFAGRDGAQWVARAVLDV